MLTGQQLYNCATPPVKSDWLKRYQQNPDNYARGGDTTLYVPVTIHLVGTDEGGGHYRVPDMLDDFCQLNEDFALSNIQFFIEGEINVINNSSWYSHDSIYIGYEMMTTMNVPNTINCYYVSVAAGSGGYNLPSADGIALRHGNMGPGSHTWAHEIGHNLSVQHTFLGWEGNIYNPGQPAPTEVYYNYTLFKPVFNPDTIIIDTAEVELVARTNCTIAADGFCDTTPDYLSGGFACNSSGESALEQIDPDGDTFNSDGKNFMSYANDVCNQYFTPEQTGAMRANLLNEKPGHLYNQDPVRDPITMAPEGLSPIQGEPSDLNSTALIWSAVSGATAYHYEVNRLPNFNPTFSIAEGITSDTTFSITAGSLLEGLTYYWRVKPYNPGYTCTTVSAGESFVATDLINIEDPEGIGHLQVYPNILSAGQSANLYLETAQTEALNIYLFNVSGQPLQDIYQGISTGLFSTEISTAGLSSGMYIIGIEVSGLWTYRKLLVL